MKRLFGLFVCTVFFFTNLSAKQQPECYNAVVKIEAQSCHPDFVSPWKTHTPFQCVGSGVIISQNLILTNAHNVADTKYLTVRKNDNGMPFTAKIAAVNNQCDLALLSVEDKKFFDGVKPMEIGDTPVAQSHITVVGYPLGGGEISITQGIISRIEHVRYSHSFYYSFLAAQIDAPINAGNSGGPAIANGKIAGIIFQSLMDAENVGYIIHTDVIRQFLNDVKDGKIDGFGRTGINYQTLESPDMRRYLKMPDNETGIMVSGLENFFKSVPALCDEDVMLEVDGFKIMNNANVINEKGENVYFSTIIDRKQVGEKVRTKILRDGKTFFADVEISTPRYKVPYPSYDNSAKYFIVGGFVFTNLTFGFLCEWRDSEPPYNISALIGKTAEYSDEEVIVMTRVLGDSVNTGFQGTGVMLLKNVNGKKIRNLADLAAIVDSQKTGFIKFEFDSGKIIADIEKLKSAAERISKKYNLPSDRSDDLK